MGVLNTGYTWPSAGQITSTLLNQTVNSATFNAAAVDDVTIGLTSGKLALKDDAITSNKIADDAVLPEHVGAGEFVFDDVTSPKCRLVPTAVAQAATTMTLDLGNGNFQIVTLATDLTVDTIAALGTAFTGKQFTILIKHQGTSSISGTATWASTWKFQGGVKPTSTGTDGAVDIISGVCDGTNVYVTYIKNFS